MQALHNAEKWAEAMFSQANLGDKRRTKRLIDLAGRMAQSTGRSFSSTCLGEESLLEGTYRFLRNDAICPSAIRRAGFEHTVELAQDIPELLALEDTTSLSYKHKVAPELGKLGKPTDKARGWWVQSVLLLNAATYQTVGLVHQEWWCRPDKIEEADEKESAKWTDASYFSRQRLGESMSKTIFVCDREADDFAYLSEKHKHGERYVVRSKHLRKIEHEGDKIDIQSYLQQQPELGHYELNIPQKGMVDSKGKRKNRPSRKAIVHLQSGTFTLAQGKQSITLNAVLAEEKTPPKGEDPLCWRLLTSEPVESFEDAMRIVRIYSARWRVEDFHKAWKTGAGAERQRMTEPDNLERAVSILAFIGVRLMQLKESLTLPKLLKSYDMHEEAKQVADQSCEHVLTSTEWKILEQKERKKRTNEPPSLEWVYKAIAKLGGFTDTKRTGVAGWDTLWSGWERLQELVNGLKLAKELLSNGVELDEM
jgi:hypothetical protein